MGRARAALPALAALLAGCGAPAYASSGFLLLLQAPRPAAPVAESAPVSPPAVAVAPVVPTPQQTVLVPPVTTPSPPTRDPLPVPLARPSLPLPSTRTVQALFPAAKAEKVDFSALPGWESDDLEASRRTFARSCEALLRRDEGTPDGFSIRGELKNICAKEADSRGKESAKAFFEAHFAPYRFTKPGEAQGFVTAYYEPEVDASLTPNALYNHAFFGKPADLVSARAGPGFDSRTSAGFAAFGTILPYFDRKEIENGALAGRNLEIAYAKDPADVLFTQIQGSARLKLQDKSYIRIGYAAHSGHRYVPVGRVMVERGIAPKEQITMDFIRAWMKQNPKEANDIRHQNRSYVFFRRLDSLADSDGPIGAQGVSLTPWRSLAVDRNVHTYGTPVYVSGFVPTGGYGEEEPFQRLMIAQDTGSAIQGPARGDLYLGTGFEAGLMAGRVKHRVDWFVLLPKSVGTAEAP